MERREITLDFVRGVAAMFFSSVMGTFLTTLIVMTPDPMGKIKYGLAGGILVGLASIFIYSIVKLTKVDKYLKKGL